MFRQEAAPDALDVQPAIDLLAALLPQGLGSIPDSIARPMDRDDYSQALAQANEFYAKKGQGNQDAVLIYCVLLIVRGLTQEASSIIRKAVAVSQNNMTLQLLQVINLMADNLDEEAGALLDGLMHVTVPERLLGLMGDLFLDLGDDVRGIECYKRACKQVLETPEIPYRLGHLLFDLEEIFDAAASFEHAARVAVSESQLWLLAAQAWVQADEYARAVHCMERVVRLEDDEEGYWFELGVLLYSIDEYERAKYALERAIALDNTIETAWLHLAHVEAESGFFDEALQHYQRALSLNATLVEAAFGASIVAMEVGDMGLAEKHARLALELDDENEPEYLIQLGIVLSELSKHEEALGFFEKALEIDEPTMSLRVIYAAALAVANRVEESLENITLAWEDAPDMDVQGASLIVIEELLKRNHLEQAQFLLTKTAQQGCSSWQAINRALYALTLGLAKEPLEIPELNDTMFSDEELHAMNWDVYPFLNMTRQIPEDTRASVVALLRSIP